MSESLKLNHYVSDQKTYRLLDKDGNWLDKNKKPPLTVDQVKYAYEFMVLSRNLDKKMLTMQRSGKMLTFAPNLGEEAMQAACALAMDKKDYFVPAFRSGCLMMMLGMPVKNQLLFWNGNESGCVAPEGVRVLPMNITIGTQVSHAAGIGWGLRVDKKPEASLCFIGDGGTAEGEFYEALNFATLRKAKFVCCINNNGFAISTRTNLESFVDDLSSKAVAVGCHYFRVDGNDLFASYEAAKMALEYARSENGGPVLLEFVSYRLGPHTTSDDPSVYLKPEEKKAGEETDPFIRTKKWLVDNAKWTENDQKALEERVNVKIEKAVAEMDAELIPTVDEVFDFTYAELTPDLKKQKEHALKRFAQAGK